MTLEEAVKRIEALEAEVAALKMQPHYVYHYHYGHQQPLYQPYSPWYGQPQYGLSGPSMGLAGLCA